MKRVLPAVLGTSLLAFFVACSSDNPTPAVDGGVSDAGQTDGPRADGGRDGGTQTDPDTGVMRPDSGHVNTTCNNPPIDAPTAGSCNFVAGSGSATLIRGNLVAPEGLLENAHLLIDGDGVILCAACDCSAQPLFADAKRLECKDGVVSPGLINAHDHITFNQAPPVPARTERYEHRHDWRRGNNGHTEIRSPATGGVRWSELRNLLAGGTSVNGSGGVAGLIRNLDQENNDGNLPSLKVQYQTFPLGDSNGTTRAMGCNYPEIDPESVLNNVSAYTPHVSEGINVEAQNEFICLSGLDQSGRVLITNKTAIIHGVGLQPTDYATMAGIGASLIWSPRSNIDLYGHTAQVTIAKRSGVRIALGTDWVATGSMNMARELVCADDYNRHFLGGFFSDRDLVDMATINAAEALGSDAHIGSLRFGRLADIAIFDGSTNRGYRAILDAAPDDVVLVMRGGEVLYGDQAVVTALSGADGCEALDVCERAKSLCVQRDVGQTLAEVRAGIAAGSYDLFFCGDPPGEPTCLPSRPNEFTGMSRMGDRDGDGMLDENDNCPTVFNPPRPLDGTMQGDADGDMTGDACDVCPLNANTETCSAPDPNDRDGDGAPNATDNCPSVANPDQADADRDMIGDACDACPMTANPGGSACPATVYAVKQGMTTGPVVINGLVVTAVAPAGYFVQAVSGSPAYDMTLGANYSGLYVYTGAMGMKPMVGDVVNVSGTGLLYFGQIQLSPSSFTVVSTGAMLPAPTAVTPSEVATGGMRAAALEGVLVEVTSVVVDSINPPPGMADTAPTNEFTVMGGLRINDLMYLIAPAPRVGQRIGYIRGVLRFANDNSKLEPRNAQDVGAAPGLVALEPATAFVAIGGDVTMTAILSRTATQATTVALSSNRADVSVPMSVTIPTGADRATFDAAGVSATSSVAATITASLGSVSVTARVRAYDDAAPRRIVALELDATVLPIGGMTTGRLALDFPAPMGGAAVQLTTTPAGRGTPMPRTATVAAGAVDAAFVMIAGTSTGAGQLVARLGTSTATVAFEVSRSTTRPVSMPGDLIITEILYNVTGSAEGDREWFEVYNPTADTLTLAGLTVSDNQGPGITLTMSAGTIGPGAYRVFTTTAMASNGGIANPVVYGTGEAFNNGGDSARLLVGTTVIDEVAWVAGWPGAADGQAMCLRAPYGDNSMQTAWGASVGTYGPNPDRGHPGVASDATNCP